MLLHVVGRARETTALVHVHVRGAGLAREQDRAAILARDGEDFGLAAVPVAQLVAQGGDVQIGRRGAVELLRLLAYVRMSRVAGAIHRRLRFAVEPFVRDDPALVGVGARERRRMAGRGQSHRMGVVRVAEPGASPKQQIEAAGAVLVAYFRTCSCGKPSTTITTTSLGTLSAAVAA